MIVLSVIALILSVLCIFLRYQNQRLSDQRRGAELLLEDSETETANLRAELSRLQNYAEGVQADLLRQIERLWKAERERSQLINDAARHMTVSLYVQEQPEVVLTASEVGKLSAVGLRMHAIGFTQRFDPILSTDPTFRSAVAEKVQEKLSQFILDNAIVNLELPTERGSSCNAICPSEPCSYRMEASELPSLTHSGASTVVSPVTSTSPNSDTRTQQSGPTA